MAAANETAINLAYIVAISVKVYEWSCFALASAIMVKNDARFRNNAGMH